MRLFLVEDNPRLQHLLRESLGELDGLEIVHAVTSQTAATHWLAEHPDDWDLAVVDIFLAEGHGFEVLRQCRMRRPEQKVVVLTNYTREPVRDSAEKLGADAVFDKSFEWDGFVNYCVASLQSR
jgi:DNA-binding NarL/FixJ family response regulator